MELILKQDVVNLGFKDDLVAVKNGYGRNYLIPHGFAVLATSSAKKVLAETLKQRAHKEKSIVKEANKIAEALKSLELMIPAKTGEGDKLFGSISNANLSESLAKEGQEIERKFITIAGGLVKRLGKYSAKVRLHRDVIVDLPFEVTSDKK
ncbi:MAG: 50S ribosomal protein L9 [Flavobacteriaceae bacterium]|nr:50S ribosomal protein L9 [Flavobacteriaceae bacterium]